MIDLPSSGGIEWHYCTEHGQYYRHNEHCPSCTLSANDLLLEILDKLDKILDSMK